MDLRKNPFHILGATTRDNRKRIIELAEERSLFLDPEECTNARAELTTPRKRLAAEVSWLPGLSPKRVSEIITNLENSSSEQELIDFVEGTPIAICNILASLIGQLSEDKYFLLLKGVITLVSEFERIDSQELLNVINEERNVSGFVEIKDISIIEEEIQKQRNFYKQVIRDAVDQFDTYDLVEFVTDLVETTTEMGETTAPTLVNDLVDAYEIEAQNFLEKEKENIKSLVDKLKESIVSNRHHSAYVKIFALLHKVVKNWDFVAQPIQVSQKSRGLDHSASIEVAGILRGLAIEMFNKYGKLELAKQITSLLREVFAEVVKIYELSSDDALHLKKIEEGFLTKK